MAEWLRAGVSQTIFSNGWPSRLAGSKAVTAQVIDLAAMRHQHLVREQAPRLRLAALDYPAGSPMRDLILAMADDDVDELEAARVRLDRVQ